MAQRFPKWLKSGPVAAILVVVAFVLGYGAIGAAVSLFHLRPLAPNSGGVPQIESAAEPGAPQVVSRSDETAVIDPVVLCDQWRENRAVFELSYYAPDHVALANLVELVPSAAPREWTTNALGEPCTGVSLWRASVGLPSGWNGPPQMVLPASEGVRFRLPDGRYVLLNPVMSGNYASASFVASLMSDDGVPTSRPVLMPTGQNRGFHGRLYAPRQQPLGAFHVWLEAGGTWQGHTISWVGVTDFSGSMPRDLGAFPSSYSCPDGACAPFDLMSVEYSPNGPDEVTLNWSQESGPLLSATYVLHGGQYRLQRGRPPEL